MTVKKIVENDADFRRKYAQKKEAVEQDFLDWLSGRGHNMKVLWAMTEKRAAELIPKTTDIQRLWTGMGIAVDKFAKPIDIEHRGREVAAKEKDADRAVVDYEKIQLAVASMANLYDPNVPERDISDFEE